MRYGKLLNLILYKSDTNPIINAHPPLVRISSERRTACFRREGGGQQHVVKSSWTGNVGVGSAHRIRVLCHGCVMRLYHKELVVPVPHLNNEADKRVLPCFQVA